MSKTKTKEPTPSELLNAVTALNSLAQEACAQMTALARMARWSLSSPEGQSQVSDMAGLLRTIEDLSDRLADQCGSESDEVGVVYEDLAWRHRLAAMRSAEHDGALPPASPPPADRRRL